MEISNFLAKVSGDIKVFFSNVQSGNFLGGDFLGGILQGGSLIGRNFPCDNFTGWNFPRTIQEEEIRMSTNLLYTESTSKNLQLYSDLTKCLCPGPHIFFIYERHNHLGCQMMGEVSLET